jgi:type VI secretion system protein ImpK
MVSPNSGPPAGRNLQEISSGLFSLILSLRANQDFGDENSLRRRIREYLDGIYAQGLKAGIPREDLEAVAFPLVAFIDETILNSGWDQRDRWAAHPLQLELFGERTAGTRFFEKLEDVRRAGATKRDLLEVYHLCLTLGFQGKFRITGRDELDGIKASVRRELDLRPDDRREVRLSPHGKRPDNPTVGGGDSFPFWRIAGVAGGVVAVMYVVYLVWINQAAGSAEQALRVLQ